MKITDAAAHLEADMAESQNQRDKRVEDLWTRLDPHRHGELDLKGLQKGLRRIDHRTLSTQPLPSCCRSGS